MRFLTAYLVWRCAWALFFVVIIIAGGVAEQSWYSSGDQKIKWFIYLTNWAFLTLCLSSIMRAAMFIYRFMQIRQCRPLASSVWYLKLNWLMYVMSAAPAIVVTLLYWALLYKPGTTTLEFDTGIVHGLNALFILLLDIFITAMPVRLLHFWIPVLYGVVYLLFAIIYAGAGGTNAKREAYIYSVLDFVKTPNSAAIYSVGALVLTILSHMALFGMYKLRLLLYSKFLAAPVEPNDKEENVDDEVESLPLTVNQ